MARLRIVPIMLLAAAISSCAAPVFAVRASRGKILPAARAPKLEVASVEVEGPDGQRAAQIGGRSRVVVTLKNIGNGDAKGVGVLVEADSVDVAITDPDKRWKSWPRKVKVNPLVRDLNTVKDVEIYRGKSEQVFFDLVVGKDFAGENGVPLKVTVVSGSPKTLNSAVITVPLDERRDFASMAELRHSEEISSDGGKGLKQGVSSTSRPMPKLEVTSLEIESPDGERALKKGASTRIVLTLKNSGEGDAAGVGVLVETGDTAVTVKDPERRWKFWETNENLVITDPGAATGVTLGAGASRHVVLEVEVGKEFKGRKELPLSVTLISGNPRSSSTSFFKLPVSQESPQATVLKPPKLRLVAAEVEGADGAKLVKPGVPATVTLWVKNQGEGDAKGVGVTLDPEDDNVDVDHIDSSAAASIAPGERAKVTFAVKVGDEFKGGTEIRFGVDLRTSNSDTINRHTAVIPYDPRLPLPKVEITSVEIDSADGDRTVKKGKQARIVLTLRNVGEGKARGLGILIEPKESGIAISDAANWWKLWPEKKVIIHHPDAVTDVSLARGESQQVMFDVEVGADFKGGKEISIPVTLITSKPRTSIESVIRLPYQREDQLIVAASDNAYLKDKPQQKKERRGGSSIFDSTVEFLTSTTRKLTGSSAKVTVPSGFRTFTGTDHAVVIGIEHYREKLPPSEYSGNDAKLVKNYLLALGFQERNIDTLTDERATLADIRTTVERKLKNRVKKDSRVFVYYSGHGAPDPTSGDAYIVPFDGDPSYIADTGYPLSRLYDSLGKLKVAEVTVVLDSCFSGAGGRSVLAKGVRPLVVKASGAVIPSNVAVLTSTTGSQVSTTYEDGKHGLFTWFFFKAISEGKKDLYEIYQFVRPQVEDEAKRMNVDQTPYTNVDQKRLKKIFVLQHDRKEEHD